MLERATNQLLSVVAPSASRLVCTEVVLKGEAETASTDGASVITIPHSFCGQPIPDKELVSVRLLAHEIGHYFQPLREVIQIEQAAQVPRWLSNLVLDIQGESMIEQLFPALAQPLTATRQAVKAE